MRDGTEGQLLQAQLAWRSPDVCSLVSAQDGAADRVDKKGFAEKGFVLLQLFRVNPKGLGEGAPLLTGNICGAGDLLGKKAKTRIPFSQQARGRTAKALGRPPCAAPPPPSVSVSVSVLAVCIYLCLSLLWVSLFSDLAMTTAAPSGQDKGSWGHGLVSGRCDTTLQSAEAWGALERPKVCAERDPGTPGQAERGSEVAEDLSLPVPVHLWGPLVDPSGPSLLLGLCCCGAQMETTFLEGVSLPGAAVLVVLL